MAVISSDPYLAFNFRVEIAGLDVGGFTEVTGLQVEMETHDYREGGVNGFVHKLAGPLRYPSNLTLKKGVMDPDLLREWYKGAFGRAIERKNVSIVLLDSAGEVLRRWSFEKAYPVRWTGPELRAGTAAVAVESLELVHEGSSD